MKCNLHKNIITINANELTYKMNRTIIFSDILIRKLIRMYIYIFRYDVTNIILLWLRFLCYYLVIFFSPKFIKYSHQRRSIGYIIIGTRTFFFYFLIPWMYINQWKWRGTKNIKEFLRVNTLTIQKSLIFYFTRC